MIIDCRTCGNEFDRGETSMMTCDECNHREYMKRAKGAIGKKVEVSWSIFPGHWSPQYGDGVAQEVLPDGKIRVLMEDGSTRDTRNFSVYLIQQPKQKQLSLFQ